jgi:hypothetical protein
MLSCFLPVVRSLAYSHREYGQCEPMAEPENALRGLSHDLQSNAGLLPATENCPSVATCGLGCELDDSRFNSQQDKETCLCCKTSRPPSGSNRVSYSLSTRNPFAGGEAAVARSLPLTSIVLLRLRMSGAILLFPPNALMPVPANLRSDFIRFRSHLSLTLCHPTLGNVDKRDHK